MLSARGQVGVVSTLPVALTAEKNGTRLQADLPVDGDNFELVVDACCFQGAIRKREFGVVALHHPATCAGAISASFESMKTNSTMLDLVTSVVSTKSVRCLFERCENQSAKTVSRFTRPPLSPKSPNQTRVHFLTGLHNWSTKVRLTPRWSVAHTKPVEPRTYTQPLPNLDEMMRSNHGLERRSKITHSTTDHTPDQHGDHQQG